MEPALLLDPVTICDTSGVQINPATETLYNKIANAVDNVTTVNYTDSGKTTVASVVQVSSSLGHTATETFNGSGSTTLVITRSVS